MQIGKHLPLNISMPNIDYLKRYVPNFASEVEQFPIGSFFPQCDELVDHKLQTDLMNDGFVNWFLHANSSKMGLSPSNLPKFMRQRETEMKKQDICRKLFHYAKKTGENPSIILSQYDFIQYIERCSSDLKEFWNKSIKNKEQFRSLCDLAWITMRKGVFIAQMRLFEYKDDDFLLGAMRELWKEAHKSSLMFRSIVSDCSDIQKELIFTKIIGFPNIISTNFRKFLCKKHKNICMGKEYFEDTMKFERFFDSFLPLCHNSMSEFHYTIFVGRCIQLGSTVEFLPTSSKSNTDNIPLTIKEFTHQISEKIDKVGNLPIYLTPTQKRSS